MKEKKGLVTVEWADGDIDQFKTVRIWAIARAIIAEFPANEVIVHTPEGKAYRQVRPDQVEVLNLDKQVLVF